MSENNILFSYDYDVLFVDIEAAYFSGTFAIESNKDSFITSIQTLHISNGIKTYKLFTLTRYTNWINKEELDLFCAPNSLEISFSQSEQICALEFLKYIQSFQKLTIITSFNGSGTQILEVPKEFDGLSKK